jgi:hypothetical protein
MSYFDALAGHTYDLILNEEAAMPQAEIDSAAGRHLATLPYPRYYLGFEAIQFAVSEWPGTQPYEHIPFQWSCHIEWAPNSHIPNLFLADDRSDPRRAFAESLAKLLAELPANAAAQDIDTAIPGPHLLRIMGLPATGPILVHNAAFERKHLLKLAQAFPDLAPILVAASERIIDLLPIARAHYPHPDMRSS